MKLLFSLLLLAVLLGPKAMAQQLSITGQVVEAVSGEPVPFASVFVKQSGVGVTADMDGKFALGLTGHPDSISVSALGFATQSKVLSAGPTQRVLFRMKKGGGVALAEVVVRPPGENPAFRILRQVQAHRAANDRAALSAAEYNSYSRTEVSLADLPKSMANRKVVKDIRALAVRQGAAAAADPDAPLPLFAAEVSSRVYQKFGPLRRREDIEHKQMRGAGPREGSVLSQMLGSNFQNFDFYPNWQNILGKDFISPLADGGRLTYDYDLQDSVFIGKDWCYKLAVVPKRAHDLAFTGTVWVTAESYALRRIDVVASEKANINFVSDLHIYQDLTPPGQGPGLPVRTRLVVGIRPSQSQAAMRVRFTTVNSDFVRNQPHTETGFYDKPIVSTVMEPGSDTQTKGLLSGMLPSGTTEGYFDKNRPDTLSLSEQQTFAVLDSARSLPSVRSTLDWIDLFVNGYKHAGPLELGPIINSFAFNNFEGARFRFGFRTTPAISRNFVVQPYVAYGTKDGRFKYGIKGSYIAERQHWLVLSAEFKHDVEQAALLDNDFLPDNNLFVAASRWGRFTEGRPVLRNLSTFSIQRDLFHGFTQTVMLREQNIKILNDYVYRREPESDITPHLTLSELVVESRYAPDENLVQAENRRKAIGLRKWPVFTFRYILGMRDFFTGSRDIYQKFNLTVNQSLSLGHLGRLGYRAEGSYTPDYLPALFLKIPLGNQTPFYNANAFNLMNYFEFVTDRSVSLRLDQHFEGAILNMVPGVRSLNWRLVATANVLYGDLSTANRQQPTDAQGNPQRPVPALGKLPYVEVGYGIENIFRFIRVDFIHRATYRNALSPLPNGPSPRNFGVKIGAQFRL